MCVYVCVCVKMRNPHTFMCRSACACRCCPSWTLIEYEHVNLSTLQILHSTDFPCAGPPICLSFPISLFLLWTLQDTFQDIPRNLGFFFQAALLIVTDFRLVYQIFYLLFALLGVFSSDFFFAFHLADLVTQFSILQNVIKSVTKNALSLLLTVCGQPFWLTLDLFSQGDPCTQ